jgi:hypothetical protein
MYATIAQRSLGGIIVLYAGIAPNPFVITSKKCPVFAARNVCV